MPYMVKNPEDRFSCDVAQLYRNVYTCAKHYICILDHLSKLLFILCFCISLLLIVGDGLTKIYLSNNVLF